MRRATVLALTLISIIFLSSAPAFALTGTVVQSAGDRVKASTSPTSFSLDHDYAYAWGINYSLPANNFVNFASITIKDLNNSDNEDNVLYVSLLSGAAVGVTATADSAASENFFATQPGFVLDLGQYKDYDASTFANYTIKIEGAQLTALNQALTDGNVGFGFDPDCHYTNGGITLNMTTAVAPEPISCVLFVVGSGVFGMAARRRKVAA